MARQCRIPYMGCSYHILRATANRTRTGRAELVGDNLRHPDTGGFSESSLDKGFSMGDHIQPFFAFDEEDMLPTFQGIGDEIVQAIDDQKVLFSNHCSLLMFDMLATGALWQSRAHRGQYNLGISKKPGQSARQMSLFAQKSGRRLNGLVFK